jgi:2,3-diketo-5-methylthiopentyl-1-phosphate enolase
MIKDDELLADPAHAPLYQRIEACQRAAAKAYRETGKKVLYFPNITDRQDRMLEKAHKCIAMGVEALMLNVHASGYGTLGALAEDDSINVPLIAHPCYSGASYMGADTGMSSHLIHGKFMRSPGNWGWPGRRREWRKLAAGDWRLAFGFF